MTKRERAALRKSIYRVACSRAMVGLYHDLKQDEELADRNTWSERESTVGSLWHGPEVQEECKAAYLAITRALQVARHAADLAAMKETPR